MMKNTHRYLSFHLCNTLLALGFLCCAASAVEAAPGRIEFSAAAYAVSEGAGRINITIYRSSGSDGPVSAQWRTHTFNGYGTADWASDYGTVSPARTLSFAAGETSKTISITIKQDTLVEGDEIGRAHV